MLGSSAEENAGPIRRLLSENFGDVMIIPQSQRIILQDMAGSLRRIVKDLSDDGTIGKAPVIGPGGEVEPGPSTIPDFSSDLFTYKCIYKRASDAEDHLRKLLGDTRQEIEIKQKTAAEKPAPPPGPGGGLFGLGRPRPEAPAEGGWKTTTKVKQFFITSDNESNQVYIKGPPDVITTARSILKTFDIGEVTRKMLVGPPYQKTYPAPGNMAAEIVRNLPSKYTKDSPNQRVAAIGNSQIQVYADPTTHFELAELIAGSIPPLKTEVISLTLMDALKMGETLNKIYDGSGKLGAIYIEAQPERNVIILRGTPEQVAEAKGTIEAIERSPGTSGNIVVIQSTGGSGQSLAEVLQEVFGKWRPEQPIRIEGPRINMPQPAPKPAKPPLFDGTRLERPRTSFTPVSFEDKGKDKSPLFDPRNKIDQDKGKKPAIVITPIGNKIIVSCDDPKMLPIVQQAVRFILESPAGMGTIYVIPLKNISAVEAARMLDEMFNGPKPQANQGGRGPGGGGRGPGGGGPGGGGPGGLHRGHPRHGRG